MEIDKSAFIASLGGPSAVDSMNAEAQADAIEDFMMKRLNEQKFGRALNALNTPGEVSKTMSPVSGSSCGGPEAGRRWPWRRSSGTTTSSWLKESVA